MDADFLLIRQMKQGDEASFDVFVRKYYKDILNYCTYHYPDREYARDITQEVFVRFFSGLSGYHYRGKTKNYLYTIARNLCRDYLKKMRETPVEEWDACGGEGRKENTMEGVLDKLTVEQALKGLSEELREVIILYYFQELKLTEIGDILHIGLPLVKYRLRQAKMQLKNCIEII